MKRKLTTIAAVVTFFAVATWLMNLAIYAGCKLLYFLLTI